MTDQPRERTLGRREVLGVLAGATTTLAGCRGTSTTTTQWTPEDRADETTVSGPVQAGFSKRVENILDQLSVREQAGQTALHATRDKPPQKIEAWIQSHGIGGILYGGARTQYPDTPREVAKLTNRFQQTAIESSSADVPLVAGIDAVHGNATVQPAMVFPHNVGLGATFDTDLARRTGTATARSMRSTGFQWAFAPVADLLSDPRWGRYYEGLSQDPLVASRMVSALVSGLQSETPAGRSAASVKHFAGYSFPAAGNDRANADLSLRRLRDRVLPPYRAGIEAGAATVMANSGSVNGVPAHASEWLLETVLRDRWGFGGLVVSDWVDVWKLYGTYNYVSTYRDAVAVAINAGVDMTMAPRDVGIYIDMVTSLVNAGRISKSRLRTAAGRVLQLKERLGLFDSATVDVDAVEDRVVQAGDRDLAREAARKSMTVLQTDGPFPIDDADSVLVTGPNADSVIGQCGGWTIGWQGITDVTPPVTTVLEGIDAVAPAGTTVEHIPMGRERLEDRDAIRSAAADVDHVVAVLGEWAYAEGSGDIDDLSLPTSQQALVETLADTATPTTGVLIAGRPRGSPGLFDALENFLMAYYPGSEGGTAVAETVFGQNPHRGGLPFTWPASIGQGISGDHARIAADGDGIESQFAFGAGDGVRVTTFDAVAPSSIRRYGASEVTARLRVENTLEQAVTAPIVVTGSPTLEGQSVARDPLVTPVEQVVGFNRVSLEAGETGFVTLGIDLAALGSVTGDVVGDGKRVLPAGTYTLRSDDSKTKIAVEETGPIE